MFLGDCFTYSYPRQEDDSYCPYEVVSPSGSVYYYYTGVYTMSNLKFERVNALPSTLAPSTVYLVKSSYSDLVEIYVSSFDGSEVRHAINKSEINAMIQTSVNDATNVQMVDTIALRNAEVLPKSGLVIVRDATGDSTVTSGAALYFYDTAKVLADGQTNADRYTKIAEYEGLDVVSTWNALVGKPTSTVADIDDAVTKRHTHTNKVQLDKITERADGEVLYNNALVLSRAVELAASEW